MKKWSIKKQLKLFILLLSLLLVSMVVIVHFGLKRMDLLNQIEQNAHELKALHQNIISHQNAYLLHDYKEEDFYSKNISTHRQQVYEAVDQSIRLVKELKKHKYINIKKSVISYVDQLYGQYISVFEKLDIALHQKGFDTHGLVGQLHKSREELEKKELNTLMAKDSYILLFNLNKTEQHFLMYSDSASEAQTILILAELEKRSPNNAELISAIAHYRADFDSFCKVQDMIYQPKTGYMSELLFVSTEVKLPIDLIANTLFHDVENQIVLVKKWLYSVLLFLCLALFVLIVFIYKNIMGALHDTLVSMKSISEGDLTIQLIADETTEFGRIRSMMALIVDKLSAVISQIQENTTSLLNFSAQFEELSSIIEEGSQKQHISVEKMSDEVKNMANSVYNNLNYAVESQQKTHEANQLLKSSEEIIGESLERIHTMNTKIYVVDEIARQTNMLSLNASVEAARVGVHGKGFGVVANEIRKLAEKSKEASTEIAVFSKTSEEISIRAKKMLHEVIPHIHHSVELTKLVSETSKAQKTNTDLIVDEMKLLRMVIQQNAEGAQELANSATSIAKQSKILNQHVNFFKI